MTQQEFIEQNKQRSIPEIVLLLSKLFNLDKEQVIAQINGWQKSKNKLPEFHKNADLIYPATISIEQCSSETTAKFKANLVKGKTLVDLTGGFGIDSYYFAKQFEELTYVEPNVSLFEIVKHNFFVLNTKNIDCVNAYSEDFLSFNSKQFDFGYIDPSRRNEKQKVYKLQDCIPNIIDLKSKILKITEQILIKTSPLLDIKRTLKELKTVNKVWVVSVNNECKEVLYLVGNKEIENIEIQTVNLLVENQVFEFKYVDETICKVPFSEPLQYLYEPNSSILKAGAFKSIAAYYNLKKLAINTHLYTSESEEKKFQGRIFNINTVIPYQYKEFKKLGIKKCNISCRNFMDSVEIVKKKLKVSDGGSSYVFATKSVNNKPILIICTR